jgi:hypothetical protein
MFAFFNSVTTTSSPKNRLTFVHLRPIVLYTDDVSGVSLLLSWHQRWSVTVWSFDIRGECDSCHFKKELVPLWQATMFLYDTTFRLILGKRKEVSPWGFKRPELEAHHSSPSSAEIENLSNCASNQPKSFVVYCFTKHKNNLMWLFSNRSSWF